MTRAVAELFEADAERVGAKAVELALAGDATALRLVIERVYPAPRERRISVALPAMRTLADLPDAVGAIIVAVGEGKLTTTEAAALAGLLAAQREAIEAASVDRESPRSRTTRQCGPPCATLADAFLRLSAALPCRAAV